MLALREFLENNYFLFVTRKGMVKRSEATLYERARKNALIAVGLRDGDELVVVRSIKEKGEVVLATANGYAIRFSLDDVRPMGRSAAGVKGIALRRNDYVVSGLVIDGDGERMEIMSISELGFGKRTPADLYKPQSRGGLGIINFKVTARTGTVVGALPVGDHDGLILLTSANKVVRCAVDEISSRGRSTSGVIVVRLDDGARVVACDRLVQDNVIEEKAAEVVQEIDSSLENGKEDK